jgi:16S rRNA (guanine966-N2)-methyltransferase
MRVIAGSLGGRRFDAPAGRVTRPTSERVREALFSILGSVEGAVALDLFAGTGALGIEALSRGAERAVFVERDEPAVRVLKGNLTMLGIGPGEAEVRRAEAFAALRSARARKETYDLVFIDPPYRHAPGWGSELSTVLASLVAPAARVVVESDRRAPVDLQVGLLSERRYGDTTIRIHLNK